MERPPFKITAQILNLTSELARLIGQHEGLLSPSPPPQLRRQNTIKTVHGSLAIEGNTLSLEQVTAIVDHKRVLGNAREILEVQNAIEAYSQAPKLDAYRARDFLKAHQMLMANLTPDAGRYRTGQVGIIRGTKMHHVAPKAAMVPKLMSNLFSFLKEDIEVSMMLKACIFHYELEFIHPFSDGNGRLGRLWQQVILLRESQVFGYVPVESIVKARQREYYDVLSLCDRTGESTLFIEFSLAALRDGLTELTSQLRGGPLSADERLRRARNHFGKKSFARKDYLSFVKTISPATASRDLQAAVKGKRIKKMGDKAVARYQFTQTKVK